MHSYTHTTLSEYSDYQTLSPARIEKRSEQSNRCSEQKIAHMNLVYAYEG